MEEVTSVNSTEPPYIFWNTTSSSFSDYTNESDFLNNSTNITSVTMSPYQPNLFVRRFYPIIVASGMVLSCVFLIFSLVVYSILPEFKNVHGKNLISMSSSLLTTFLVLSIDRVIGRIVPYFFCFSMGMVVHIAFLATFFWTNVMAFDVWKSLTDLKAKRELIAGQSNKFLKYSIYAWTASVLSSMPVAALEFMDWVPLRYRPKIGVDRCWMTGYQAFFYLFNLPVGAILFCNLVLFLLTTRKLFIVKKMTAVLNVKKQQQSLYLYMKLLLVMGITWMAEFLPCVIGVYQLYPLAGILTGFRGFFLFLIFVANRKTLRNFYCKIRCRQKSPDSCSNSQQTPSSNKTESAL